MYIPPEELLATGAQAMLEGTFFPHKSKEVVGGGKAYMLRKRAPAKVQSV